MLGLIYELTFWIVVLLCVHVDGRGMGHTGPQPAHMASLPLACLSLLFEQSEPTLTSCAGMADAQGHLPHPSHPHAYRIYRHRRGLLRY